LDAQGADLYLGPQDSPQVDLSQPPYTLSANPLESFNGGFVPLFLSAATLVAARSCWSPIVGAWKCRHGEPSGEAVQSHANKKVPD
jgi:hypothetical protein